MIVLIGFMGAGKTTVGRILATTTGATFVDTDEVIERRAGASVAQIFETAGEAGFRELEREVVTEVLAGPDAVVALGGGALGDPATCAALEWATVIHLDVGFAEAMRRVGDGSTRPLLVGGDPKALHEERRTVYERVGKLRVDTDAKTPEEVAHEVAALAGLEVSATEDLRRVTVALGDRSYDILIGDGVADRAGELVGRLPDAEKALVVSHEALADVAERVGASFEASGLEVARVDVPEGERSKDIDYATRIYDRLTDLRSHRSDVVVGVGGGVVTDLSGFVASTFHRGMPLVLVPTTLLAQVDAAIGGKTAVNLDAGKNLVGTFHQPRAVICDVATLSTLPDDEVRSGLAEVVKYGFIAEPGILELVEHKCAEIFARDPVTMVDLVARCAQTKARFVAADETDRGSRAALNYGHTFAHAIEQVSGFGSVRHGEAVALGMVAAAHLAVELGYASEDLVSLHRRVLEAARLPVGGSFDLGALEAAWAHDKKHRGGTRFVLLRAPAQVETGVLAPRDAVAAALAKMSA